MSRPLVVVAALVERGGRVLVSRRRPGVPHGGLWEFPGGKREAGETDAEALRRELREELGVDLEVVEPVWTTTGAAVEIRFLRCRWRSGLRPRPLGCEQFRWVRREDLAGYRFPPADAVFVVALAHGRPAPPAAGRAGRVG